MLEPLKDLVSRDCAGYCLWIWESCVPRYFGKSCFYRGFLEHSRKELSIQLYKRANRSFSYSSRRAYLYAWKAQRKIVPGQVKCAAMNGKKKKAERNRINYLMVEWNCHGFAELKAKGGDVTARLGLVRI